MKGGYKGQRIVAASIAVGGLHHLLGNHIGGIPVKNDLSSTLPSPLVLTPDQFFTTTTNGVNNVPNELQLSKEEGYTATKSLTVEGVSHLIRRQFNDKTVINLIQSPPTTTEVNNAIEVFREHPEAMGMVLPSDIELHQLDSLLERVREISLAPGLIDALARKMDKKEQVEEKKTIVSSIPSFEHPPKEWLELRYKYPCSICQDVLAAPVLLECEHSFCGHCIMEHCQACQSNDIEVVYKCPVCCEEYVDPRYERQLDGTICDAVENIPDCKAKREWTERRELYLSERKKTSEKVADQPSPAVEDYGRTSWWVACMVVSVITLIVLARARK
eukprot:gene6527-7197_t